MDATANGSAANAEMASSVARAIEILSEQPCFQHRLQCFSFEQAGDVLIIEGIVPTFYLKQLLQTTLKRIGAINRLDNRVRVVSSAGLSSVDA